MAATTVRRVLWILWMNDILVSFNFAQYSIPKVNIQVFKPKGFQAWIEDAPNIGLFTFQGNINKAIGSTDVGQISGEVVQPTNGRWLFESDAALKVGDVINYHVFVAVNSTGYVKDNLSYVVTDLVDRSSLGSTVSGSCSPTATVLRSGTACAGQIIFEDDFDSFRENVWQIEQFIPVMQPELPFVTYQRLTKDPTVSVAGGFLQISPKLQTDVPGFNNETLYSGTLNLFSGCTGVAETCIYQASGADIIPPVISGRITTKNFAFTYGTVHVRAKLPLGDWLYPDILLEPFLKKYGSNGYASGLIRIANARGNRVLTSGTTDFSNKVLYGGPIMDYQCRDTLVATRRSEIGALWSNDYHTYSIRWAPDRITLSVDGEEWARVEPAASGLVNRFPNHCQQLPRTLLAMGSKMAPFDDHFVITLGVAAGGITEFPDGASSSSGPKPWSNHGRKAVFNFWQDMPAWKDTWTHPQLLIDYVKVVAL